MAASKKPSSQKSLAQNPGDGGEQKVPASQDMAAQTSVRAKRKVQIKKKKSLGDRPVTYRQSAQGEPGPIAWAGGWLGWLTDRLAGADG